jgi:tRNA-2-methylthio-N6-dimethylallyladenosine synthase
MNISDSERIATVLEKIGFKSTQKENEADLIMVNMCSVRQSAVDRVYGVSEKLKKLKEKNKKLLTILTGCVLKKDKIKLSKKFDFILNINNLPKLPEMLGIKQTVSDKDYLKIKPKYQSPFSAYIPIMTGCNNFCSYCAVPYTKGREISRPVKDILSEIENLVKKRTNPIRNAISNGAREIWLVGQNVNSYQSTGKNSSAVASLARRSLGEDGAKADKIINFPKLLKMVDDIPGNFWIRFTSPHPKDFSNELIKTMAKCKKVTEYLNLPVQSGDDKILKKMNRPYTIKQYKNLVKKIRARIPDITLSTDVIVGFPSETKKQFENTVKLFKEIKYDMAYIAQYSPRPGTAAAKLEDDVKPKEKERRWKILTNILKKTALEKNKKNISKEVEVLPEEYKNGFLTGKSKSYKTVRFEGKENLIGKFIKLKIIDAFPWSLKGILK